VLLVGLVPMVALQWYTVQEVRRQVAAADDAAAMRSSLVLLQDVASLVVPLSLELALGQELLHGDAPDDFRATLLATRAQVDEGVRRLSGTNDALGTDLADSLTSLRSGLDSGALDLAAVALASDDITGRITAETAGARLLLDSRSTSLDLSRVGTETNVQVRVLEAAATVVGSLADHDDAATMAAEGALDASVARLAEVVDDELAQPFEVMIAALTAGTGANDLLASIAEFTAIREFASLHFDHVDAHLEQVTNDALDSRRHAIVVLAVAVTASALLLVWTLRSTLRPLFRLVRHARKVSGGELDVAPGRLRGPTEVRVLTHAFGEMVTTLRAYEAQVQRLATGDTGVTGELPGPLGETLRQSVHRLATVTSQLQASEEAAHLQARTDALTGLTNRTAALEHLGQMLGAGRGAVILVDIDGFKHVNETQGHAEADRVLADLGMRMQQVCEHGLVARYGGDEFLVLVDTSGAGMTLEQLATELLLVLSAPSVGGDGQVFSVTASLGVTLIGSQSDPLVCIAQADSAVQAAKDKGGGRVEFFDVTLAGQLEQQAEMAMSMRRAITDGEFVLHLQPLVDGESGQPVAAEVLVRWMRPGIGEVAPSDFIPIAERTGLVVDLETYVLEQTVNLLREWRLDPLTARLRLAVNVSGRHIVDGHLVDLVDRLCTRASIDPDLLELEITETHLVADIARAQEVVGGLRALGVGVAIDDFGAGYSSLTYLHQLQVDTVKIDQVFVAGMLEKPLDRNIVELLVRLSSSLGMRAVAEGVDSQAKLDALRQMGCPLLQGYHIARPAPVAVFLGWLKERSLVSEA